MNKSARYDAHGVLKKVLNDGAFLNIALKDVKGLSAQDMALVTRICNTTLEHLNQIDYILEPLIGGKRVHGSVRLVLRMATCEALFMSTPFRAVVFEAVNLAKEIGKGQLSGFVNAVLRRMIAVKENVVYPDPKTNMAEYLRVFTGYPEWLIAEMIQDYGESFAHQLMTYTHDHHQTHVRLNTLAGSVADIVQNCVQQGLEMLPDGMFEDGANIVGFSSIASNQGYLDGEVTVMGQASMLCVRLAGAECDMRVLDACAAPVARRPTWQP